MEIEFDPAKDLQNRDKHGISLARSGDLEIYAQVPDDRYDEPRYRLYGLIDDLWYCLAATDRGDRVRAISLRRAHQEEIMLYVRKR